MLNRTNRTLSANLNRLNLGTRTLASQANGNLGMVTLRSVPASGDSPRGECLFSIHEHRSIPIRHGSWHSEPGFSRSPEVTHRQDVSPVTVSSVGVVPGSYRMSLDASMQARVMRRKAVVQNPITLAPQCPSGRVVFSTAAGSASKREWGLDATLVRADSPAIATTATAGG